MEFLTWARLQWDRAAAVVCLVLGVLLVLFGWSGAADTPFIAEQVPYVVSGGIGGLVLLMVGGTLWLSADMNDEWRVLDRLDERDEQWVAERDERWAAERASLEARLESLEALLSGTSMNGHSEPRRRTQTGARSSSR